MTFKIWYASLRCRPRRLKSRQLAVFSNETNGSMVFIQGFYPCSAPLLFDAHEVGTLIVELALYFQHRLLLILEHVLVYVEMLGKQIFD